jgi:hypothetical protein
MLIGCALGAPSEGVVVVVEAPDALPPAFAE